MAGKLYIVGTPIGNLGDITDRAKETLSEVDVIFCEDTRVTGKLLSSLGIKSAGRLRRLDENMLSRGEAAIALYELNAGRSAAFCSDAGMPGISDPGVKLVDAARDEGIDIEVIPGPTAIACALALSGINANAHYFGGFFPRKDGERQRLAASIAGLDAALVFYESPKRLLSALAFMNDVFPHRTIAVCRELTKIHEEVLVGYATALLEMLQAREALKGEFVIVIGKPSEKEMDEYAGSQLKKGASLTAILAQQGVEKKVMMGILQDEYGVSRNDAYELIQNAYASYCVTDDCPDVPEDGPYAAENYPDVAEDGPDVAEDDSNAAEDSPDVASDDPDVADDNPVRSVKSSV